MDHTANGSESLEKCGGLRIFPNHLDVLREPGNAYHRPITRAEALIADPCAFRVYVAGLRAGKSHIADSRRAATR